MIQNEYICSPGRFPGNSENEKMEPEPTSNDHSAPSNPKIFSADAGYPGGPLRGAPDHHTMTRRAKALGVTLRVPASLAKMCLRPKRNLNFEKSIFLKSLTIQIE